MPAKLRANDKTPADAFAVFKHATLYVDAEETLRLKLPSSVANAAGSILLNAFASELLLKCLLLLENADPPPTHRLDVLFRRLNHKHKRRIVDIWDRDARDQIRNIAKAKGLPTDLPNALVKCGQAFERIRYHYEAPDQALFYIGRLPKILVAVIAEIKPTWVVWTD